MNDLQKVELEMLKLVVEICNQLELKYFLVCGSALGAVKYNGFIEWDDDVDIALMREDYEEFLRRAPEMLPQGYFLQNMHTQKAFPLLMTKLRKDNTTLLEEQFEHLPMHHGISIDIFPLDGYTEKRISATVFEARKWFYNKYRCFAYKFGYKAFGLNRTMRSYERMLKKYKCDNSDIICNHANWQKKLEYAAKEQYGNGTFAEFEGLKVRVPENYDAYLTQKYGDWRKELPPEQRKSHHRYKVCDINKPYTEYVK